MPCFYGSIKLIAVNDEKLIIKIILLLQSKNGGMAEDFTIIRDIKISSSDDNMILILSHSTMTSVNPNLEIYYYSFCGGSVENYSHWD